MVVKLLACMGVTTSLVLGQPSRPTQNELRELLVNKNPRFMTPRRWDSVFYHEDYLRPSIRAFLRNDKARENAQEVLALIGDPVDLRVIVRLAPNARPGPFSNRWAYRVATALLEPRTEEDWAFLRACALNHYNDRWVDAGAIQTLKLIASPRSLQILIEVQQRNVEREKSLARAVAYVQSNPPPLRGAKLEEVVDALANIISTGNREGNQSARFNERGDKALVDLVFQTGVDRLTYTATFHRIDGLWRLRGLRETLQEFSIRIAAPVLSPSVIPAPPELIAAPPVPTIDMIVPPIMGPPPHGPVLPKKE